MKLLQEFEQRDLAVIGEELHQFAAELYPICRSIMGNGTRETLAAIGKRIPLVTVETPTGTQVFDWTIPKEWNIRDAYIKDASGTRIVDFQQCNLHVVNYSAPVHATMPLEEMRTRLHSIPGMPDAIPYRTSYYREDWGFCLSHKQLSALADGQYEVRIDSSLEDGNLTYGECYIPGESEQEVLISCHVCHPSLANDNLSGIVVATELARLLHNKRLRYSYRFLFAPGTIGAITWLAQNRETAPRIIHGLVLTGIGDSGGFHYKKSRRGDAEIDKAAANVLRDSGEAFEVMDFTPFGYDERQYCSPGFNLPVGCLMRSVWGTFPEYHTSQDNLNFIRPDKLAGAARACAAILDVLENNNRFCNQNPHCEPQLGRRGLYRSKGGETIDQDIWAKLWVLNLSDGHHSLLDISERSGLPFSFVRDAADALSIAGLLVPLS
jgi:aminopeptidase-like protein